VIVTRTATKYGAIIKFDKRPPCGPPPQCGPSLKEVALTQRIFDAPIGKVLGRMWVVADKVTVIVMEKA
jgi:hypothetical protein